MSIRTEAGRRGEGLYGSQRRCGAARITAMLASLCGVAMLLGACAPRGAAVGDTAGAASERNGNGAAVVHDSVDKGDVTVGVIGSDDAALDRSVLAALSGSDLDVSYVSTNRVRNPLEAAQQGVEDLSAQAVSVILVSAINAEAGARGWDEALGDARNAGIPVALINPRTPPRDAMLFAAQLNITASDAQAVPIAQAVLTLVNDVPHGRVIAVDTAASTMGQ